MLRDLETELLLALDPAGHLGDREDQVDCHDSRHVSRASTANRRKELVRRRLFRMRLIVPSAEDGFFGGREVRTPNGCCFCNAVADGATGEASAIAGAY
jgi:hypothetical protein